MYYNLFFDVRGPDITVYMRKALTDVAEISEYFGPTPVPVEVNKNKMLETASKRYKDYCEIYVKVLPEALMHLFLGAIEGKSTLNAENWARCVWLIFREYLITKDIMLLDALRIIWLVRFADFYEECKDMDLSQAEDKIRENAEIFENVKYEILEE